MCSVPGQSCGCEISRRELLRRGSAGFGMLALSGLIGESMLADEGLISPPHHPARAKRVIFLFMHGGPSQVDTFDYKPLLERDNGKALPFSKPRVTFAKTGNLLKSPWEFRQYGESGMWVSDLFPNVATCVDDICFLKSLHGTNDAHGGALLALHTGSDTFVRPSMGSWAIYGLGSENENLPGFITICPTLGHGGVNNWSSAFLPASFQGTPIGHAGIPARNATINHLSNKHWHPDVQKLQLGLMQDINLEHLGSKGTDDALEARIRSFEMAFRMQAEAPMVMDLSGETKETLELYGIDDSKTENFGRQCLMARRFAESGVRFIQCTHSYKWDQHSNLKSGHQNNALEVDRPIAGLLKDLKSRGLLEDTLVLWGGEFGRTPTAQDGNGRDHNPHGFTMWMAGGGVRGGNSYGETDDYGYYASRDKVHVNDLHATLLHLLGIDHEKLTFRHAGRDFRLTDVAGEVVHDIIA
ncbi:MAG TPA: DUF1501 domain-containing protein [Planctomycetes bacterium]|nr:DUF1501 domain-containing protein [Planctomycetota bacterium]